MFCRVFLLTQVFKESTLQPCAFTLITLAGKLKQLQQGKAWNILGFHIQADLKRNASTVVQKLPEKPHVQGGDEVTISITFKRVLFRKLQAKTNTLLSNSVGWRGCLVRSSLLPPTLSSVGLWPPSAGVEAGAARIRACQSKIHQLAWAGLFMR